MDTYDMSEVIHLLSLFKNSSTSVIVSSSVVLKLCCPIKHKLNYKQIMEMQTQDKPYSCGQCNLSFKINKDIRGGVKYYFADFVRKGGTPPLYGQNFRQFLDALASLAFKLSLSE